MADDKTKDPLDVWLGRVAPLTALATFTAVLLSIVHEYGYYLVVGQHFFSALTTTDILRAALLWLLPTLILFATTTAFMFLASSAWHAMQRKIAARRTTKSQSADAIEAGEVGLEEGYEAVRRRELVNMWFAMGVIAAPTAAIAWFVSAAGGTALLGLLVAIAVLASSVDLVRRTNSVRSTIPTHTLDLKEAGVSREVVLLRSIDKGLVFRDPARDRVELLRWEDVRAVSQKMPAHRPGLRGGLCRRFGFACFDPLLVD